MPTMLRRARVAAAFLGVATVSFSAVSPAQTKPAAAPKTDAKPSELPATSDPKEIVRRSVEVDHDNLKLAQTYTCQQREVEKRLGKHGEVKSTEVRTYDVNFYYGDEYARLIQKNDQPLSADDKKKEDEKLEKFLAK